jgi:hypothetical protein
MKRIFVLAVLLMSLAWKGTASAPVTCQFRVSHCQADNGPAHAPTKAVCDLDSGAMTGQFSEGTAFTTINSDDGTWRIMLIRK